MTPLHALAQRGRYDETIIEMVETLVTRGAVVVPFVLENSIRRRGGFAEYRISVLQWLVDHGADVNIPMRSGTTLLYFAVHNQKLDLVSFLLKNGSNVSVREPRTSPDGLRYCAGERVRRLL